jgi:hypothetical protein
MLLILSSSYFMGFIEFEFQYYDLESFNPPCPFSQKDQTQAVSQALFIRLRSEFIIKPT